MENLSPIEGPSIPESLNDIEKPRGLEGLKESIIETSQKLQAIGIPVDRNLRIIMNPEDEKEAEAMKKEFDEILPDQTEIGEKLELLTAYILNKYLGEEFITVRTSLLDDYKNHADIIILDRKTKSVICALDDVGATSGSRYEEKKQIIEERNIKENGAKIKYCLTLDENNKFSIREDRNIPLTYLALSSRIINGVINNINSTAPKDIELERKTFNYFLTSIYNNLLGLEINLNGRIRQYNTRLDRHKIEPIQSMLDKVQKFRQSLESKIPLDLQKQEKHR